MRLEALNIDRLCGSRAILVYEERYHLIALQVEMIKYVGRMRRHDYLGRLLPMCALCDISKVAHDVFETFGMDADLRFLQQDDFRWGGMVRECHKEEQQLDPY